LFEVFKVNFLLTGHASDDGSTSLLKFLMAPSRQFTFRPDIRISNPYRNRIVNEKWTFQGVSRLNLTL
jgi:hypothetical protein